MTDYNLKQLGNTAENQVCQYLQQQKLELICRNFRCNFGEIDLIMQDKDLLVFVEVRMRTNQDYASALESVTRHKQRKIIRTALFYLQQNNLLNKVNCRFDVVAVEQQQPKPEFNWIKDAFQV